MTCSAYATDGKGVLCEKGYKLYADYLGCMCDQTCAKACADTACALSPTAPSPACSTCMAGASKICDAAKTACMADKPAQ